ncbi:unnamed protein product [Mytilus coruscus]|uniref:C2H2-type domain-containing protein n=1 Tax=Mytilus coruscus TaxID=42192 RepID=A0A6J8AD40_MYTCO|nr:unnamed protein product [Mytilus coruscus]
MLAERCDKVKHLKWYINVHVELSRETNEGEVDNSRPYFKKSNTYILLSKTDIKDDDINEAFQKQFKSFDEYIARGSGWTLKQVINMELHTIQFRPIGGSSYFRIPETLEKSHAIINIKNDDKKCFLWSVLAHIHTKSKNANRISQYIRYEKELNMSGIAYPVQVKQIPKFENQNDISINVLGYENNEFFPIYISQHKGKKHEVDLLYLTKRRLLSRTKNSGRAYKFCRYCLRGFTSQRVLEKHLRYCSKHDAQHVEFPVKDSGEDIVEFDDYSKQMKVPFVIYCDFEAFACSLDTCYPNPNQPSSTATTNYEACGYGYQLVCETEQYSKAPVIYRGLNAYMEKDKHLFDFSNYDKNHFLFDKTYAKKPGLFKDETGGVPIKQFVGLRSKMYSLTYGDVEQKRAKGIVKSVKNVRRQQNLIQSRKHKLQMVSVNKVALSAFDDKRYVMDNGVDTLAFGHFKIKDLVDK